MSGLKCCEKIVMSSAYGSTSVFGCVGMSRLCINRLKNVGETTNSCGPG